MRDDTIRISGPFEVPDLDVPEYTDEDGQLVPEHTLDMSRMRRFEFETRSCHCGRLHGYTVEFDFDLALGWPEIAEHILTAGCDALVRSLCPTPA